MLAYARNRGGVECRVYFLLRTIPVRLCAPALQPLRFRFDCTLAPVLACIAVLRRRAVSEVCLGRCSSESPGRASRHQLVARVLDSSHLRKLRRHWLDRRKMRLAATAAGRADVARAATARPRYRCRIDDVLARSRFQTERNRPRRWRRDRRRSETQKTGGGGRAVPSDRRRTRRDRARARKVLDARDILHTGK